MKKLILAVLCCGFLGLPAFTQVGPPVVKKPAAATHAAPDLLVKLGMPKRYMGAVMDKKTHRVVLAFVGTWVQAPTILGGSTSITYSRSAAVLADFLNPGDQTNYQLGFNLGQKNGQVILRSFRWPVNDPYGLGVAQLRSGVPQEDEGILVADHGTYSVELESSRILFRAMPKERWEPTTAQLFRWVANDLQVSITPNHPDGVGPIHTPQFVPPWSVGSYLVLSDGFLAKAYFRFFGGTITYVVPGIQSEPDHPAFGATFYLNGNHVEKGGNESLAELWDNGLRLIGTYAEYSRALKFRKGLELSSITTMGRFDNEHLSTTSELAGDAQAVAIPGGLLSEVLDRSREDGWSISAGPYSLKRVLLSVFKDCTLVPPIPALCPTRYPTPPNNLTVFAENFNKEGIDAWRSARGGWEMDAQAGGGRIEVPKLPEEPLSGPLAALGRVVLPGQAPQ